MSYPSLEDKETRGYAEIARESFTEKGEILELEEESDSKEENRETFFATKQKEDDQEEVSDLNMRFFNFIRDFFLICLHNGFVVINLSFCLFVEREIV